MADPVNIGDQRLFDRFLAGGFTPLVNDDPLRLSEYLVQRSVDSGNAAFALLAEAIRNVYFFFLGHDEAGGSRIGFVQKLDRLVIDNLASVQRLDPPEAARVAQEFRAEIERRISLYRAQNTYGGS
jgi:hypothetical protein